MSDETSAAISAIRRDWAAEHREMYLRSGGAEGHIMDTPRLAESVLAPIA